MTHSNFYCKNHHTGENSFDPTAEYYIHTVCCSESLSFSYHRLQYLKTILTIPVVEKLIHVNRLQVDDLTVDIGTIALRAKSHRDR